MMRSRFVPTATTKEIDNSVRITARAGVGRLPTVGTLGTVGAKNVDGGNSPEPTRPKPGTRAPIVVKQVATKEQADADTVQLLRRGEPLPSQETLRVRWGLKQAPFPGCATRRTLPHASSAPGCCAASPTFPCSLS